MNIIKNFIVCLIALLFISCDLIPMIEVMYKVDGNAKNVEIILNNASGDIIEFANIELPWSYHLKVYPGYIALVESFFYDSNNDSILEVQLYFNNELIDSMNTNIEWYSIFAYGVTNY